MPAAERHRGRGPVTSIIDIPVKRQALFLLIIFLMFLHGMELAYRIYQRIYYGSPILDAGATAAGMTAVARGHPLMHYVLNSEAEDHTPDLFRATGEVSSPERFIVCMGGSSTYGTSVPAETAYPAYLQRFLNQGTGAYKVFNAGVPGWSMPHHVSRYVHDLRYLEPRIDMVILYAGVNDARTLHAEGRVGAAHDDRFKLFPRDHAFWMRYRFLIWFFTRLEFLVGRDLVESHLNDFANRGMKVSPELNQARLDRFGRELALLLHLLDRDGVRPLVVLQDHRGDFPSPAEEEAFYSVRRTIARIAGERGNRVIDMHRITRSNPAYFTDVIHMSRAGNEVRARALAEVVREIFGEVE